MSKIEELIKEKCPNGVKYKKIGDIANYRRGSFPQPYTNESYYGGDGAMPFVQVADVGENFKLVTKTKNTISKIAQPLSVFVPSGTVIVTLQGTIGRVAITQYDSYVDRTLAIFGGLSKELNTRYFAYQLKNKFDYEKQFARGSTIKTITKEEMTEFKIPLPPIDVQEEIVRILDKFCELEAELEVELEAELEARKSQYEFWRESLLNNDYDVETLDSLCLKTRNINWNNETGDFNYIDLSSVNRNNNTIEETNIINSSNAPSRAKQIIKQNDVLFGTTRPMLKRITMVPEKYNNQICSTGYCVLRPNIDKILPEWLYYNLQTNSFYEYVENFQQGASYPSISDSIVKKYEISVPSISEQRRIINLLSKFDTLVNDISEGLPEEIEARRKQYEYYRNKLLSFEEVLSE